MSIDMAFCNTCNKERGVHPHMSWGGQLHHHQHGRYWQECREMHRYCLRIDCTCGNRGSAEAVLVNMGLVEGNLRRERR